MHVSYFICALNIHDKKRPSYFIPVNDTISRVLSLHSKYRVSVVAVAGTDLVPLVLPEDLKVVV